MILVDNSASPAIRSGLEGDLAGESRLTYVDLGTNSGVAAALNAGVRVARARGCEQILLLDQDSVIDPEAVRGLISRFGSLRSAGVRIGGIGPHHINARDGEPLGRPIRARDRHLEGTVFRRREVITSGFVTSLDVLDEVGPFLEELFIDYVDFEWCWRAQTLGYVLGVDTAWPMRHALGVRDLRVLGVKFQLEAPIRSYYQFRNYLLVARLPHSSLYFLLRQGLSLLRRLVLLPFLGGECSIRWRYILAGLRDGVAGRTGRIAADDTLAPPGGG